MLEYKLVVYIDRGNKHLFIEAGTGYELVNMGKDTTFLSLAKYLLSIMSGQGWALHSKDGEHVTFKRATTNFDRHDTPRQMCAEAEWKDIAEEISRRDNLTNRLGRLRAAFIRELEMDVAVSDDAILTRLAIIKNESMDRLRVASNNASLLKEAARRLGITSTTCTWDDIFSRITYHKDHAYSDAIPRALGISAAASEVIVTETIKILRDKVATLEAKQAALRSWLSGLRTLGYDL